MKVNQKGTEFLDDVKIHVKLKLSALWITLMFLYVYADILSFFRPKHIEEIIAGMMGPFPVTQTGLWVAAILMTIPSVMIFLSLTLKPQTNRWVNIIVGLLYTLVNMGNLIGESWAYYIFFGIIEILCTLLIIGYAWKWPNANDERSSYQPSQ